MARNGMRRGARRLALMGALVLAAGCGGGETVVEPDPSIAPFVGDWSATAMTLTSLANPDIVADLIALGATFNLNVQPSGQYTAILIYAGQASTEIGFISVSGDVVTLRRSFPSADTSSAVYSIVGNRLTLDGDSDFDFNLDGTAEAALAHIEFDRQ